MDTEKLKINTEDEDYKLSGNNSSEADKTEDKMITPPPVAEEERNQALATEDSKMEIENQELDQEENSEVALDYNSDNLLDDQRDLCDTEDSSAYDEMDAAYEAGERVDLDIDDYEQKYVTRTNSTRNNNVSLKKKKSPPAFPPAPKDVASEDSEYDNLEKDIPREQGDEEKDTKAGESDEMKEEVTKEEERREDENLAGEKESSIQVEINKNAGEQDEETNKDVMKEGEGSAYTVKKDDLEKNASKDVEDIGAKEEDGSCEVLESQSSCSDEELVVHEEEAVDIDTENHEDETSSVASGVSSGTEPELENIRSSESSEEENGKEKGDEEHPIPSLGASAQTSAENHSPTESSEEENGNEKVDEEPPMPSLGTSAKDSADNLSTTEENSKWNHPVLHPSPIKVAGASSKQNDVFHSRPIEEVHSFAKIDQGTKVHVRVLKNYFEEEITRVTPDPGKKNQSTGP